MKKTLRHAVVPAFVLLCLLLGGSPQGIWRNLALQLVGIAMLAWALLARNRTVPTPAGRALLVFAGLWFLLVLLQLVPLPPSVWTALPGRDAVVQGFLLRGEPLPSLPLSLTPAVTAAILPVMVVPVAVIAAMLWLGAYRSRWVVLALVAGTLISVLLGALQFARGGPYLYPIYNAGSTAGLFANSNHHATLMLATIPFLAAIIGREQKRGRSESTEGLSRILIAAGGIIVVLLGIALNGSLAALLLMVPVALASVALAVPKLNRHRRLVGGLAAALLLVGAAGLAIGSKAGTDDTSIMERGQIYERTLAAIGDTFPVGTGLGSFESYYRLYEDRSASDRFYINHAHSDPLEWVLETGLPGALLLLLFVAWWLRQSWVIWRSEEKDLMALAGSIGSATILAHSLVDYPLRDAAIQAVFALCLAFMVEPRSHAAIRRRTRGSRSARHLTLEDDDVVVSA